MSEDDYQTLREIDVSYFRDHVPPDRWPNWLLAQTIHTAKRLPGVRAWLALKLLKQSQHLLKGRAHA